MNHTRNTLIASACLIIAMLALGLSLSQGLLQMKSLDRTVEVKGLSEREVPADTVIWPIAFQDASNELGDLYNSLQAKNAQVREFLLKQDIQPDEISVSPPAITDLQAQNYVSERAAFRYTASSTVTVYSTRVEVVRAAMGQAIELSREGVAVTGQNYQAQPQFLFNGLNQIKPEMIEEATRNAREVGEKFAQDSDSKLGKIRTARQGQFSINDRDSTTAHIKRVRVVSTVEYYLAD